MDVKIVSYAARGVTEEKNREVCARRVGKSYIYYIRRRTTSTCVRRENWVTILREIRRARALEFDFYARAFMDSCAL